MEFLIDSALDQLLTVAVAVVSTVVALYYQGRKNQREDDRVRRELQNKALVAQAEAALKASVSEEYETKSDLLLIQPLRDRLSDMEKRLASAIERLEGAEEKIRQLQDENVTLQKDVEDLTEGAGRLVKQVESLQGKPVFRPEAKTRKASRSSVQRKS